MNPLQMYIEGIKPDTTPAFTTTVVLSGIVIVLGMLILLIFIFYGFGAIMDKSQKSIKARQMKKAESQANQNTNAAPSSAAVSPAPVAPSTPAPTVEGGISDEVVAVITAAVAAQSGSSGAVIRSIKKNSVQGRNPWASAAVVSNTMPF